MKMKTKKMRMNHCFLKQDRKVVKVVEVVVIKGVKAVKVVDLIHEV